MGRQSGSSRRDGGSLFAPVAVARASSAIAEQIRTAIVTGQLGEGDRLPPERELAEQFGVSRVTIRDALRGLEAMGLIDVRVGARGGAFVTIPSGSVVGQTMADMMAMSALTPEDIAEARLIVELGTVTLACARATEAELDRIRELCDRADREVKAKTYTPELSWEFHALLAEAAHNGAVEGMTGSFRGTLSMHALRVREPRERSYATTAAEHRKMLEALERRDADAARRVMADHLLRGTKLERHSAPLLDWWRATPLRAAQRGSTRRAR